MIRDPLYRDIEARLGGKLDPETFEQCAADLLRSAHPTLVPVRGGENELHDGRGNHNNGWFVVRSCSKFRR